MKVQQIIMSCRNELKNAEHCNEAGHPEIAIEHLRKIFNILKKTLPGESPEPNENTSRTTDPERDWQPTDVERA